MKSTQTSPIARKSVENLATGPKRLYERLCRRSLLSYDRPTVNDFKIICKQSGLASIEFNVPWAPCIRLIEGVRHSLFRGHCDFDGQVGWSGQPPQFTRANTRSHAQALQTYMVKCPKRPYVQCTLRILYLKLGPNKSMFCQSNFRHFVTLWL